MPLTEPFFRAALEHVNEGVLFLDLDNRIVYANPALRRMCGIENVAADQAPADEVLILHDAGSTETDADETTSLAALLADTRTGPVCGRFFLQHRDGHRLLAEVRLLEVHNRDGTPAGTQVIITDASPQIDLSQLNRCMHKLIRIDSLTHLPNQRALADAIKTEYLRFARYGIPFALVATTLDSAPSAGSGAGAPRVQTTVLQWFARQLTAALRKSDTPGRLRGDLFLALLPHTDAVAAARAARKIQERLLHFPCPDAPALTASFGCAAISRQDTIDRLQQRARRALYRASSAGGDQVVVL